MPAERRIVAGLIAAALLLTSLPYLLGYFLAPPGGRFIGAAYNIDDYCNYLSWLRQTAEGHFFLRNLFTTDPQKGLEFNVFFWLLGLLVRVTHLPPPAALQIARLGGGMGLLWLIACVYRRSLPQDPAARLAAFGFTCLSSGFGWMVWPLWHDKNGAHAPVDAWQPEAYTFLSLYTSALFTVSTLLIVGALYALLRAEQTRRWSYAACAGGCGAILGNMHSYDVLHLSAAWGLFLVVWTLLRRGRGVLVTWARGLLALALTLPTTLYQYYVFRAETVFHKRAEVGTLSPAFWHYGLGYGLVFLLALAALITAVRLLAKQPAPPAKQPAPPAENEEPFLSFADTRTAVFFLCWAVAGLLVIYLPVAFQRKMLMGEHIPLCLLAGVGAAWLTRRFAPRPRAVALAALVLLSFPSNALFLWRDFNHLIANRSETALSPMLSAGDVAVFSWLRDHTAPDAAIVGFPSLCAYVPGETGRAVWAGHWGETPSYGDKVKAFGRFAEAGAGDAARRAFLASTGAQYLFYPSDVGSLAYSDRRGMRHEFADFAHRCPPYLTPVYGTNVTPAFPDEPVRNYTVFRISLPP